MAGRKISAVALARMIGVHPITVHSWLDGRWRPMPARRAKVARILGVAPEMLWPDTPAFKLGKGGRP